jgi:hypothetical protein
MTPRLQSQAEGWCGQLHPIREAIGRGEIAAITLNLPREAKDADQMDGQAVLSIRISRALVLD